MKYQLNAEYCVYKYYSTFESGSLPQNLVIRAYQLLEDIVIAFMIEEPQAIKDSKYV